MRNAAFTFLVCIFGIMIFTGIIQAQTQTSSMVYKVPDVPWFDLETGTIIEQTAAADFQFVDSPWDPGIVPNTDVKLAISGAPYDNVQFSDITSLTFEPAPQDFIVTVVVKTAQTNYYKLGFVSKYDTLVTFQWEQLFPPTNRPPVALCQNVTISADSICQVYVNANQVDNGSYDPDGNLITLSLSPPAPYPIGETEVTLTVSDGQLSSTCMATITVDGSILLNTLIAELDDLIGEVDDLVTAGVLTGGPGGEGTNLISRLNDAIGWLSSSTPNGPPAKGNLGAFIGMVGGLISSGRLSSAEGQPLIDAAQEIIDAIIQCGLAKQAGEPVSLERLPYEYKVSQNYPNPFNPSTVIKYQIPKAGFVTLKVFDVLGKEVKTLIEGYRTEGRYEVEFDATNLPSGIYFYKLQSNNFVQTKKMILLK